MNRQNILIKQSRFCTVFFQIQKKKNIWTKQTQKKWSKMKWNELKQKWANAKDFRKESIL